MSEKLREIQKITERQRSKAGRFPLSEYQRPVWETLRALPLHLKVKWADRFAPAEAIAAEWAVAGAIEKAFEIEVPVRAQFLRGFFLELQRLIWGTQYYCDILDRMEDPILLHFVQLIEEQLVQAQDSFLGHRVLPQWMSVGGVSRDLSVGEKRKSRELLGEVKKQLVRLQNMVNESTLLNERLTGVLPLSYERLLRTGVAGPVGQASGIFWDMRRVHVQPPYRSCHDKIKMWSVAEQRRANTNELLLAGDARDRLAVVGCQMIQSCQLMKKFLIDLPDGPVQKAAGESQSLPSGTWSYCVEAPSGPLWCLLSKNEMRFGSYSMLVTPFLEEWLFEVPLEDLPLAYASLGYDMGQGALL